jgi:hypothetical protein
MIGIVLGILLTLAVGYGVVASWLLVKASRKLLQFDDLVNYLVDDMETNVKYFDDLTSTPVLSNAPEIMDANKNMTMMSARLDEYLSRFEELTGTKVRKLTVPKPPTLVG